MSDDPDTEQPASGPLIDRRTAIVSLAGVLAVAGCAGEPTQPAGPSSAATTQPRTRSPQKPAAQVSSPARGSSGLSLEPSVVRSPGPDITYGPRNRREVALTFHGAGDPSLTERVLRACADHDARITVFAVGQWLAATPALGPQILAAGHELGNHTWSHRQMPSLSAQAARDEIRRGADALRQATGSSGWWFRPSGTPHSTPTIRAAASRSGYLRCISYDVDPQDYRDPGAAQVVARTLAQVRPGSIVSLHLGHPGTVSALPQILVGLAARKLAPETLSRLLRD
jgi:peptidoglycan/xylan/chitin deacetylase (PgdA/CDA1 family)